MSLSSGKGNQIFHIVSSWLDFISVIIIIVEFWILIFTLLHVLRITVWEFLKKWFSLFFLLFLLVDLWTQLCFIKTGNHLPQCLWFSRSFFTVDGCINCVQGIFEFLSKCFMEYFKILDMPNERCWIYMINSTEEIFWNLFLGDKWLRKGSLQFKHPYRHRRNRSSTPALDLLSPYLPGPELFISPPISTVQTRPAYSTVRSDSSLSSVSSFTFGHSSSVSPMMSFDSNLIPSNSGSIYMESSVVQDLSVRLTGQSVLPPADRLVWAIRTQYFIHGLYSV